MNPFPAPTIRFSLVFYSNLLITFEAAFKAILFTNPGKIFLAKGMARFFIALLPIVLTTSLNSCSYCIIPINPPD